ncbi:helix-turn-helix domain-containing protein [Salinarchaeum sp. IM2453]|uniref:helix-turn-helix domain-containing protein n=1 Tax=Salinarchaeum sp. IM2453 TaxID=2862870 RepID=UPI001C83F3BF|nr:helix-turn-helix domain-containing protein [Salinarchaeum sp. IM2453]QZA89520.1 helix-turn-helix domain-containing protein [Salinarchaeum sp. IM2453]
MTRFVAPLGFSSHRVTQPVIAHGFSQGDQLVLLQPEQPDSTAQHRAESAVSDVKSTLRGVASNIEVTHRTLMTDGFSHTVEQCSEILTTGEPPVACIGGGATDIHVPFIIAVSAHADKLNDVLLFRDTQNAAEPVDLPQLTAAVPPRAQDTFQILGTQKAPLSISDIATEASISESTASRHVQMLEESGLVRSEQASKRKVVAPTPTGKLLIRNS